MSVFIRVYSGEIFESQQSLKKIKSDVLEISNDSREFIKKAENYAKELANLRILLTELEGDFFKLRNLLPKVPETVVPKIKELQEEVQKPKTYEEELKNLREMIKKI
ncbi:MAG: hypothetical protein QXP53_02325 [Candidatus Pacearchaeota archaeon]